MGITQSGVFLGLVSTLIAGCAGFKDSTPVELSDITATEAKSFADEIQRLRVKGDYDNINKKLSRLVYSPPKRIHYPSVPFRTAEMTFYGLKSWRSAGPVEVSRVDYAGRSVLVADVPYDCEYKSGTARETLQIIKEGDEGPKLAGTGFQVTSKK
jgi:predicted phosphohydrolase